MAPDQQARVRTTIRKRLADALTAKGWDAGDLAERARVEPITVRRWLAPKEKGGSVPSLTDAKKAADALDITLDWLTGNELTAEQTVAAVATRVERETEAMRLRLDQLMADLTSARAALIGRDEVQLDVAVGRTRKSGAKQVGQSVTVASESAG